MKIREAFDKAASNTGRSLDASFRACCSGETHYLQALLCLISGDMSESPLGSDKEEGEDEEDAVRAGTRARETAFANYRKQDVFERGESLRKTLKKEKSAYFGTDPDNDEIPNFVLDDRARSTDVQVLFAIQQEANDVQEALDSFKDTVKDEVLAMKESYFAITSHCYETETWIGILRGHVRCLKKFNDNRDQHSSSAATLTVRKNK